MRRTPRLALLALALVATGDVAARAEGEATRPAAEDPTFVGEVVVREVDVRFDRSILPPLESLGRRGEEDFVYYEDGRPCPTLRFEPEGDAKDWRLLVWLDPQLAGERVCSSPRASSRAAPRRSPPREASRSSSPPSRRRSASASSRAPGRSPRRSPARWRLSPAVRNESRPSARRRASIAWSRRSRRFRRRDRARSSCRRADGWSTRRRSPTCRRRAAASPRPPGPRPSPAGRARSPRTGGSRS